MTPVTRWVIQKTFAQTIQRPNVPRVVWPQWKTTSVRLHHPAPIAKVRISLLIRHARLVNKPRGQNLNGSSSMRKLGMNCIHAQTLARFPRFQAMNFTIAVSTGIAINELSCSIYRRPTQEQPASSSRPADFAQLRKPDAEKFCIAVNVTCCRHQRTGNLHSAARNNEPDPATCHASDATKRDPTAPTIHLSRGSPGCF
ncbi:hypothetical protein HPB48_022564 [Haemaphysalis longicornis]|uniref:Uncharacterized protein n=1 Tax=Haemaphysalis longicornis TaxID=44386 RepID=A0A9J6H3X7_HAELO|nr:hypothetical protein HPB48_022564 [Haemaphysalis longicornis]